MALSSSPTIDLLQEALALHRRGAVAEAAARYAEVLRADPANADAHYYLGLMACQGGRFAEGAELACRSLSSDPQHVRAHVLLGRALSALGRHEEALDNLQRAIMLAPELAEAHSHCADVFSDLGRHREAVESYDRAVFLAPDAVEDWCNRGLALASLGRHEEAIASFDRAIACRPEFGCAYLWRAKVLSELGRYDDALVGVDKALAIEPSLAEAWLGRGNVLKQLKRYDEALGDYEKALALKSDLAEIWLGRGNVLFELKRYDDALGDYEKALASKSDLAEAWLGRGNVLFELKRYDEALGDYEKALASKSDLAEAWLGRGLVLSLLKHYEEAIVACDRAMLAKSDLDYAVSLRLHAKRCICNWKDLEAESAHLLWTIRESKLTNDPAVTLTIPSSAVDQLLSAKRFVLAQPKFTPMWRGSVYSHDRIRVAYLSANFCEHAVAHLTAGLFEQHDKSRFEVFGISFGPDQNSEIRQRLRGAFERFMHVADKSDREIADLLQELEIDIAVDLMGFTLDNRLSVLARRPAPIQVNYLGYPGTVGADYIDYIIADRTIIPADQRDFYTEQVVWLPESYLVNDNRRAISERKWTRSESRLPETGAVFCCFNNIYKITPAMFDVWMRLLKAVDNSALWLGGTNPIAQANLHRAAEQRGVAAQRLVFAPRLPDVADHLARHRQADLFLDTLPYNAHTTASDALWAGLPVLTCIGSTFAGRVAASLLKAIGLDELIAHSLDEYEALALKLAREPTYLASIKAKLARNRDSFPLFDTKRFTRHIEAAYTTMWERYQRGEVPQAFAVSHIARTTT